MTNLADAPATTKSAPSVSEKPAPAALPWTAATRGASSWVRWVTATWRATVTFFR
jgi:hypothetical protein